MVRNRLTSNISCPFSYGIIFASFRAFFAIVKTLSSFILIFLNTLLQLRVLLSSFTPGSRIAAGSSQHERWSKPQRASMLTCGNIEIKSLFLRLAGFPAPLLIIIILLVYKFSEPFALSVQHFTECQRKQYDDYFHHD